MARTNVRASDKMEGEEMTELRFELPPHLEVVLIDLMRKNQMDGATWDINETARRLLSEVLRMKRDRTC